MYQYTDNLLKVIMERQGFTKERIEEILKGKETPHHKTFKVTKEEMKLLMTDIRGIIHRYSMIGEMSIVNSTTLQVKKKFEDRIVNKKFGY